MEKRLQTLALQRSLGSFSWNCFYDFFSSGLVLSKNNNIYISLHAFYVSLVFPLEKLPALCLTGPVVTVPGGRGKVLLA